MVIHDTAIGIVPSFVPKNSVAVDITIYGIECLYERIGMHATRYEIIHADIYILFVSPPSHTIKQC